MMLRPRNIYFAGTALLTAAAANGAGLTAALYTAGFALVIYGIVAAIDAYDQ